MHPYGSDSGGPAPFPLLTPLPNSPLFLRASGSPDPHPCSPGAASLTPPSRPCSPRPTPPQPPGQPRALRPGQGDAVAAGGLHLHHRAARGAGRVPAPRADLGAGGGAQAAHPRPRGQFQVGEGVPWGGEAEGREGGRGRVLRGAAAGMRLLQQAPWYARAHILLVYGR